jgi:hypothetical protein
MSIALRPRVPTRSWLVVLAAPLALLPIACSAPTEPESAADEPVGEVASATVQATCVTIQRGTFGAVKDSILASDLPTKIHGTSAAISAGQAAGGGTREALVEWDTSSIPAASIVTSATATFVVQSNIAGGPVNIHQITAPWSEASVTWNSFNQAFNPAVAATTPGSGTSTANLTALAQGWVDGSSANNGILMEQAAPKIASFNSSEATGVGVRPSLQVCYVPNPCAGVVCSPIDACHAPGVCNTNTGLCGPSPSLADTTSGLSHRWTFDEGSGATAGDSAGAAPGALGSSASWWTSFDGSSAVAMNPTNANDMNINVDFGAGPGQFGTADFTVSFWVATTYNTSGHGDMIGNRVDPSNGDYLSCRLTAAGVVNSELDNYGTNFSPVSSTPVAINDGNWHNVVLSRNGTAYNEYIDGVLLSTSITPTPTNVVGAHPFKLGRSLQGYVTSFAAVYDDVRIYNRALNSCDTAALTGSYAGTPATFPPPPPPSCPCAGTPQWDSALAQVADACYADYPNYADLYYAGFSAEAYADAYGTCYAYDPGGNLVYFDTLSAADGAICMNQLTPHCP